MLVSILTECLGGNFTANKTSQSDRSKLGRMGRLTIHSPSSRASEYRWCWFV